MSRAAELPNGEAGLDGGRRQSGKAWRSRMMTKEDATMTKEGFSEITALMGACKGWFDGAKVPYTGGDIVAMARLVIAREREIADRAMRDELEARHRIGDDAS